MELFSEEKAKLKKWRYLFKYSLILTFALPVGLVVLLIAFNHQQLSFDLSNLNNWRSINDVYKFPFSCFSGGALISTLFGLRLRVLQTDLQLLKANYQIELATKKENAVLFVEHKKDFKSVLDGIFKEVCDISVITNPEIKYFKASDFIVNFEVLYNWAFPKNSFKAGVLTTEVNIEGIESLCNSLLTKSEKILETLNKQNENELKEAILSGKNQICADYIELYNTISKTGMGSNFFLGSGEIASYERAEIIKFMPYIYTLVLLCIESISKSKEPEFSSKVLWTILEIDKLLFSKNSKLFI